MWKEHFSWRFLWLSVYNFSNFKLSLTNLKFSSRAVYNWKSEITCLKVEVAELRSKADICSRWVPPTKRQSASAYPNEILINFIFSLNFWLDHISTLCRFSVITYSSLFLFYFPSFFPFTSPGRLSGFFWFVIISSLECDEKASWEMTEMLSLHFISSSFILGTWRCFRETVTFTYKLTQWHPRVKKFMGLKTVGNIPW